MNFEDLNNLKNPEKINNIEIYNTKPESIYSTSKKDSEMEMYDEIYHLRDTFLESEREYVNALLEIPAIVDFIISLNGNFSTLTLYSTAKSLIDDVENYKVKEEKLEFTETCITILLAAIQDEILRKTLVKIYESNNKDKSGESSQTIPVYYEEEQQISRSR